MILGKSVQFRTVYDALLFIRHLVYDALPISWGFFMTHLIFDASYISRILDFLCNMLYMCSIFYMIFVQFLGVIKCLNNPFFTICRIAHTKKPHRAKFLRSLTVTLEHSTQYRRGTYRTSPFARFKRTLHISCVPLTDAVGLDHNRHLGNPTNIERR